MCKAAVEIIQLYPPFGGYPGNELAVRIAGRAFAHTTEPDVKNQRAGVSGTFMPLDADRKSSKTHISNGSQVLFYADARATIAMLGRRGRVSLPNSSSLSFNRICTKSRAGR